VPIVKVLARLRSSVPETAIRYVIVGVANTCVGLGVIYASMYFLRFSDTLANGVGYVVGVMVSFVLNRNWTFEHAGPVAPALVRFVGVLLVAYFANLATVLVLIEALGINRYLAQAAGVAPYTTVGYLGSRHFAFHNRTPGSTSR
jgi:putative flippase GtrA